MNNSAIFNDPRAKRWGNFIKWATILVVGFLVAPFIWISIEGLLGLICAGAVLGATWMVRPWLYSVAANARLALVKSEAMKNPVETLQNTYRENCLELDNRKTKIETLAGKIRTFASKVDEIRTRYGVNDSNFITLNSDLGDLKRLLANRSAKWQEARQTLNRFEQEIEKAQVIWEASLAAAGAREASGLTEDDFLKKLKTETAFDAIQTSYNEALASLDVSLDDEPVAAKLGAGSGTSIPIEDLNQTKVKAHN